MSLTAAQPPSAEAVVQAQVEAYNARDIDAFLATYTDDAELFDFGGAARCRGKEEMRVRYTQRFSDPILHARIAQRIVMGHTVIDHERVYNTFPEGPGVLDAVAIYEVREGKIARVTFITGPRALGATL